MKMFITVLAAILASTPVSAQSFNFQTPGIFRFNVPPGAVPPVLASPAIPSALSSGHNDVAQNQQQPFTQNQQQPLIQNQQQPFIQNQQQPFIQNQQQPFIQNQQQPFIQNQQQPVIQRQGIDPPPN